MAFIQPCFIRKNTTELRKKLEELGYKYSTVGGIKSNNIVVSLGCIFDIYPVSTIKCGFNNCIDCGTNEELFIALAALRDDTDVNQWFIMDVEVYTDINQNDWFLSTDRNKGKHIGTQIDPMYCHKATVKEIIEHFKNKDNV